MKTGLVFTITLLLVLFLYSPRSSQGGPRGQLPASVKSKPGPVQQKGGRPTPTPTPQPEKPPPSVPELVSQGKALYKATKYKPALAKFEDALKQEPDNDEALGLAAVTAFRLDNQSLSRDYFLRRAGLPKQKDSVKAYCYYQAALSHWRQVHDIVAKFCEPEGARYLARIPDRFELDVKYGIGSGLENADRALKINQNYTEAYNVKNLLHSEAALVETDETKANEHHQQAMQALRRAISLFKPADFGTTRETADFGAPTIRISEYGTGKEAEIKLDDSIAKLLEGGKPLKRITPPFPSVRPPKSSDSGNPSAAGVTADGGAYSLGSGRGALTAAYAPGKVKIEVLVAVNGSVIFTHIIDGRSDLNGAAVLSARSWKFEPAKFEGRPVQVSGVIVFSMRPK